MREISALFQQHMSEVYLLYGISFLFLATIVYLQPREKTVLPISLGFKWLALFGILHGLKELLGYWGLIFTTTNPQLIALDIFLLIGSYCALFEFARLFWTIVLEAAGSSKNYLFFFRSIQIIVILLACAFGVSSSQFSEGFISGIRYFIGFPSALLAGAAFLAYEHQARDYLKTMRLNIPIQLCGYSFLAYSVFSGLIVKSASPLPDFMPTYATFLAFFGVPVQLFRAFCAIILAVATGIIMYRVNAEKYHREYRALAQLAEINAYLERIVADRTEDLQKINKSLLEEIEERCRIEKALRFSQDNLYRAQSIAHIGSWYLTMDDTPVKCSDETYRIFNLPLGSVVTYETFLACVHPEDREKVAHSWQSALTGADYDIEHRIIIDDSIKWLKERAELQFDAQNNLLACIGTVQDITELKQSELALQQSLSDLLIAEKRQRDLRILAESEQSRMAALLSAMSIGILFEDKSGIVEYVNLAFRRMWAIGAELNPVGKPTRFVLENSTHRFARPDHASKFVLKVLDTHEISERFEIDLYDGRIFTQVSYPVTDAEQAILGRLWIYEDITHERQTAQQLLYLAEHDTLSGLYNRRRFQEQLDHMINNCRRNNAKFALIYFDLDEFKYINDTFGHRAGDTVLSRVASEISAVIREIEIFARLGGDEFAILSNLQPQTDISIMLMRIINAVSSIPFRFRGTNIRQTISVGVAFFPDHGETVEDLVAHADTAMYQAKSLGKNTWAVYDPNRDHSGVMVERMTWRRRIEQALEQDLLELHLQGIFHVANKNLSHFEVLIRMRDPSHPEHLIMPDQFIPIAEISGQILEIDRWVLRHSIRLLGKNIKIPALAVNISGRSFDDTKLPKFIQDQLSENCVNPNRLIIELTETEAVSDIEDAQRFIEGIRQAGCSVCLDDFGSGFSTFAYLKYLNADILKIDGMFIRDLPINHENQIVVKAMVDIAKGLRKIILAEFVENDSTLKMIHELGIDLAQGYHLGRPVAYHDGLVTDQIINDNIV